MRRAVLCLALLATQGPVQALEVKAEGQLQFNYQYGLRHPELAGGQILLNEQGYVVFEPETQNSFGIFQAQLGLWAQLTDNIQSRLSYALTEADFAGGPLLNGDDFRQFGEFLQTRQQGHAITWLRPPRLKDAYLIIQDQSVKGSLTLGQHPVPFRPWSFPSLLPPLAIQPRLSPLVEWLNLNPGDAQPYQSSTLTRRHEMGATLQGDYQFFSFTTGFYNGTGTALLDNNNYKDFLLGVTLFQPEYGQIGAYHLRGRNLDAHAPREPLQEVERARYGLFLQVGNWETLKLRGELILADDRWADATQVLQKAGYLYLIFSPLPGTELFAAYDIFRDENPRRSPVPRLAYFAHGFMLGLRQHLHTNLILHSEYSYYWEFAEGESARSQFGNWVNQISVVF